MSILPHVANATALGFFHACSWHAGTQALRDRIQDDRTKDEGFLMAGFPIERCFVVRLSAVNYFDVRMCLRKRNQVAENATQASGVAVLLVLGVRVFEYSK
jgi:hypothetical protein